MRERVFICSPLSGDFEANRAKAEHYCALALRAGFRGFAPHAFYPRFLNEFDPAERAAGIAAGLEDLAECKEIWVFIPLGLIKPSTGMQMEIDEANRLGIPFRYMSVVNNVLVEAVVAPVKLAA